MRTTAPSFPSLLLAAHGSADPAGQAAIAHLVSAVRRRLPGIRTQAAYLDHLAPTLSEALAGLASAGSGHAVVVPLLLTAATHSKSDIAAAVAAGRAAHPGLDISYGRPLGPHPLLTDALADRLAAVGVGADDTDVAVVLASAGASEPDSNADVAKQARLLLEGRGWVSVEPAFASATRPSVEEVVRRLRRLEVPRIVVAPYFLGPGRLLGRVRRQAGELPVTEPLATHPNVATLVGERFREAVSGNVHNSCDTCMFRTPMRGHEDRAGAPLPLRREAVS